MNAEFNREKALTTLVAVAVVVILMTVLLGFWVYANHNQSHSIKDLGSLGSYMNVVVAMSGIITVGLVFYGVRVQGLEFQEMNKKLQAQIDSSDNNEKINRTVQEISNWNVVKNDVVGRFDDYGMIRKFTNFFDWLELIKSSDLSGKYDTDLIENAIYSDDLARSYMSDLSENIDGRIYTLYDNHREYFEELDLAEQRGFHLIPSHPHNVEEYYKLLKIQESLNKGIALMEQLRNLKEDAAIAIKLAGKD